jgi:multidrug transporter EmrE-like cation transporter
MTQLLRIVFQLSWWLGLLSIVAAVVVKLLQLEQRVTVTGHTLFLVASAFFLCALATREMQRAGAPT